MEITRFGPGNRREIAPPGSRGVSGQVIYSDQAARVSELAFERYAMVSPHSNPNIALFVVVSGGGYVQVGGERSRVSHGEAVVWPADVPHGAFTDGSEMRAIVVELGQAAESRLLEGTAVQVESDTPEAPAPSAAEPARGSLAQRGTMRDDYDSSEGEPW
jgi:quercetin dioxygenase-like cupin family protein